MFSKYFRLTTAIFILKITDLLICFQNWLTRGSGSGFKDPANDNIKIENFTTHNVDPCTHNGLADI